MAQDRKSNEHIVRPNFQKTLNSMEGFVKKFTSDPNFTMASLPPDIYLLSDEKATEVFRKFIRGEFVKIIRDYHAKLKPLKPSLEKLWRQFSNGYLIYLGEQQLHQKVERKFSHDQIDKFSNTQNAGIEHYLTLGCKSEQTLRSSYTDAQLLSSGKNPYDPNAVREYSHNCYKRDAEGLSALRKHTFSINGKPTISYYHHSSPVPYKEKDYQKRMGMTERNLQQFAANALDENKHKPDKNGVYHVPITEIRLLSPMHRALRHGDNEQKQYQQILETYVAMLRIDGKTFESQGKKIQTDAMMFVYGTNSVRNIPDPLQSWINTRSLNMLFKRLYDSLDENVKKKFGNDIDNKLKELEEAREELSREIKALSYGKGKSETESKVRALLEEHHKKEEAFYKEMTDKWHSNHDELKEAYKNCNDPDIKENIADFQRVMMLLHEDQWEKNENNYQIQATLVRLNCRIGREVGTGCNDCKDRDGRLTMTVEGNEMFRGVHGKYPDPSDNAHKAELQEIQKLVYEKSTIRYAAEAVSIPGADDCELHARDGNAHLPTRPYLARLYKDIFGSTPSGLKPGFIERIKQKLSNLFSGENQSTGKNTLSKVTVGLGGASSSVQSAGQNANQDVANVGALQIKKHQQLNIVDEYKSAPQEPISRSMKVV